MPDIHSGYGFAIGNVAAFDMGNPEAVVSPRRRRLRHQLRRAAHTHQPGAFGGSLLLQHGALYFLDTSAGMQSWPKCCKHLINA